MKWSGWISIISIIFFSMQFAIQPAFACKDIIACNDATAGDFNLLLKIRDPSRPGYQTISIVPKGYTYEYHHPWTGKPMRFETTHKMICVASEKDTLPNIVKAGMCFTDAGLAFGDADTVSNWKNPSKYAWDDFDWIRYAAQSADTEKEALDLLTEEVVDDLHATGVPENLFVVGPESGFVVEADVIHYDITEVSDYVVMSNYAKNLWKKSIFYRTIGPSFDATFEGTVRKGKTVRLGFGSIFGIRILDIGSDYVEVKQIPIQFSKGNIIGRQIDFLQTTRIYIDDMAKVGFYSVRLLDIEDNKATITMCFEYNEWERLMKERIDLVNGAIDVDDLMHWSRIHSEDLDGLRGMCDENEAFRYEGDMIYKIPSDNYDLLSQGWFSPSHACCSIYIPVHIGDTDIYDPYETGEAAKLSLSLLDSYGHDYFSESFHSVEQVFINELAMLHPKIIDLIALDNTVSDFLTISDMSMQNQAFITQQIYLQLSTESTQDEILESMSSIWSQNYSKTLYNIKDYFVNNTQQQVSENLLTIAKSIVQTRIDLCESTGISCPVATQHYEEGLQQIDNEHYEEGFTYLINSFHLSNAQLLNEPFSLLIQSKVQESFNTQGFSLIILMSAMVLISIFLKKKKK
jgi:hypothetical protein